MSTRRENKIIIDTLKSIVRRYGRAYNSLLNRIPELLKEYYEKNEGWRDVQEEINNILKPVNEFGQIIDYNNFYTKAYRDAIRQNTFNYGFTYNFSQVDQRAIDTLKSPNNWFVSKYQTLTDQRLTLNEMEQLWLSGESVEEAAKKLNDIFNRSNNRINAYTKSTLVTNNTRIRSTADLNNFSTNGIVKYIYRAVIDDVTTEMCEELNGREYSIKKALEKQTKTDEDVNKIIQDGQRSGLSDWKIYNKTMEYLQKNDALANQTGSRKRPWQTATVLRTANPQKQGKRIVKSYKNLESVPGNKIPRPPVHHGCRSRIEPKF